MKYQRTGFYKGIPGFTVSSDDLLLEAAEASIYRWWWEFLRLSPAYWYARTTGKPLVVPEMAKAYEVGQPGMPQNYRLAVAYYTRAAMRRDPKSIRILSDRYEAGDRTPRDLQQAYAWRLILIEIEDTPDDVGKLGLLEKKMELKDVQAGQELAIKLIKDLPSDGADALARLNPSR
jgi:hypothetical protein